MNEKPVTYADDPTFYGQVEPSVHCNVATIVAGYFSFVVIMVTVLFMWVL